jgi:hypothetical protein
MTDRSWRELVAASCDPTTLLVRFRGKRNPAGHGKDSMLAQAVGRNLKGKVSVLLLTAGIFLAFFEPWIAMGFKSWSRSFGTFRIGALKTSSGKHRRNDRPLFARARNTDRVIAVGRHRLKALGIRVAKSRK